MCRRGPNKWRDSELPVKLLENWCLSNHCPEPEWGAESETAGQNTKLTIKGTEYKLSQFGELVVVSDVTVVKCVCVCV